MCNGGMAGVCVSVCVREGGIERSRQVKTVLGK